jgi:hypothetical protein
VIAMADEIKIRRISISFNSDNTIDEIEVSVRTKTDYAKIIITSSSDVTVNFDPPSVSGNTIASLGKLLEGNVLEKIRKLINDAFLKTFTASN